MVIINLLEDTVVEILSEPIRKEYKGHEWWELKIKYTSYGRERVGIHSFSTKKKAEKLQVGDTLWR